MAADYQLELIQKIELTPDITSFYFKKPEAFEYSSGQYMKVTVPIEKDDSKGNTRFFTISSSPTEDRLMITTKMQQSEFKKSLYGLQVGDLLAARGPYGSFTFHPEDPRCHVFIAGGVGITPFRSMLRFAADQHLDVPVVLIYSYNDDQGLFLDELSSIAHSHTFLSYYPLISSKDGRITPEILKRTLENLQDSVYYITGPTEMVDDVSIMLETLGVGSEKVQKEYFSGYSYE